MADIKLFDVKAQKPKFAKGLDVFSSIVNGIITGQGLKVASDLAMDKVSKKAKRDALLALYKDDKVMYDRIRLGVYSDKVIDQMFKDNVDKIIEYQNKL